MYWIEPRCPERKLVGRLGRSVVRSMLGRTLMSARFPVECRAKGIRARVVFSRDCWEAIVVSSVNACPSWTENGRLRFVLSRFLDDCSWPKVGQVVSFEVQVRAPDGKPQERVVKVELRIWDGEQDSPFLWFYNDGEQST